MTMKFMTMIEDTTTTPPPPPLLLLYYLHGIGDTEIEARRTGSWRAFGRFL